jgi:hypothetical protein
LIEVVKDWVKVREAELREVRSQAGA